MLGSLDLYLHEQAPHFLEGWGVPFPNSGYCLRDHEGSGRGDFTESEAGRSLVGAHPEGVCTGTWTAHRISTN